MKLNNLIEKNPLTNEEWKKYKEETSKEFDDYFSFVLSLSGSEEIHEKMLKNYSNLEIFVTDSKKTLIPRFLCGNDRSFFNPHRAISFNYKQDRVNNNGKEIDKLTQGLSYRYDDKLKGIKYHELNHNLSNINEFEQVDGNIYKYGLRFFRFDANEDIITPITGDFINEGMTDAIAKYYYDKNKLPDDVSYSNGYDNINQFMSILLGKDLSNQLLLNAYFGDMKDFAKFEKHFDEVMQGEKITFKDLCKMDINYANAIDGFFLDDDKLIIIACKYRINQCKTQEDLANEFDFIKTFKFNLRTQEEIALLFENKSKQLKNNENESNK